MTDAPLSPVANLNPSDSTADVPPSAEPGRGRPFQPGQSGNPKGRPPGKRNAATLLAEELIDGETEAVIRRLIEQAKAGEPHALRLYMERTLSPRRERYVQFDLPELKKPTDAPMAHAAVIRAVADGNLTLTEANGIANLIDGFVRSFEVTEFSDRLRWLEEISNAAKFVVTTNKTREKTGNHTRPDDHIADQKTH